jgi:hypothetical protein
METTTAARIFYDWAGAEGLLEPAQEPTSQAAEIASISPVTDAGKQLLRAKQIQAVGFNEPERHIVVFTRRAVPTTKKALNALPQAVDDVEVKYRQGAQETIGEPPSLPFGGPPYVIRQTTAGGKYACGSSVSVGNYRDAGTLGCLVRDGGGGLFGFSNNHVTGACSYANVGLPIVAPGIFDVTAGGLYPFTLGLHERSLAMVAGSPDNVNHLANFDCALFRILDSGQVTSYQGNAYDTPAAAIPLVPDLLVEKVGRTTGHTHGKVISQLHGPHAIVYNSPLYGFAGLVYFEPVFTVVGTGGIAFSDHGDSGALITALDAQGVRKAAGIVVGGMADKSAPGGKTTIAFPVQPLLAQLGVSLVSGHNI